MTQRQSPRAALYRIIFQSDTPAGKLFDVFLIVAILLSVSAVLLDSVPSIAVLYGTELRAAEWFFTVIFSIEYLLRLYSAPGRLRYAGSFFGLVDLLAILPTYLDLIVPGGRFLLTIRALRLLRVFRVLKLVHFVGEQNILGRALWASRYKITVFILSVFTIVVIVGSLMHVIEGEPAGFSSIPIGVYWAVVTLTTVGFGDITPQTPLGQMLATVVMVIGYGIIAVPTGIVTVELGRASLSAGAPGRVCQSCGSDQHDEDASFCKKCGDALDRR